MPEPSLELQGLAHSYQGPQIFAGVSLSVAPGEQVALLGASGSGKSTILRAVAGFVTPSEGAIKLAGQRVAAGGQELVPAERRGVGLLFQDYALFPHMSVGENILFGLNKQPGAAQEQAKSSLEPARGRPGASQEKRQDPARLEQPGASQEVARSQPAASQGNQPGAARGSQRQLGAS